MSWRTRDAIASLGLEVPDHRSRQATAAELDRADLVIALAREHVAWMRRVHPDAAPRTATLKRLARDLDPAGTPFGARVAGLGLDTVDLGPWEDVVDPAGGDIDVWADSKARIQATLTGSVESGGSTTRALGLGGLALNSLMATNLINGGVTAIVSEIGRAHV